jgi:anti-anti-sigma factor
LVAAEESPSTVVLVIGGSLERAHLPELNDRVRKLVEASDARVVVCDVSDLVVSDIGTLDALARLALTVMRLGRRIRLYRPCERLRELVALSGLSDVLPSTDNGLRAP